METDCGIPTIKQRATRRCCNMHSHGCIPSINSGRTKKPRITLGCIRITVNDIVMIWSLTLMKNDKTWSSIHLINHIFGDSNIYTSPWCPQALKTGVNGCPHLDSPVTWLQSMALVVRKRRWDWRGDERREFRRKEELIQIEQDSVTLN